MKQKRVMKNIVATLVLPVGMYLLMLVLTRLRGITFFGSWEMWRVICNNLCFSVTIALGIAMQVRFGRLDFSGGSTMLLAGFVGVLVAQQFGDSAAVMLLVSILTGVVLSAVTAGVYIVVRLPIIICTIAMTLLYESLTLIIGGGNGANIISNASLNIFGRMPVALVVCGAALLLYHIVVSRSVLARQGDLLANGQQTAVNIGIKENRNVFATYLLSGILFGLAGVIYAAQNRIVTQSNLSTAGILFSYIVPVFVGLFFAQFSNEVIGIVITSLTIELMNYGLNALGIGSGGWDSILFGVFLMTFWVVSGNLDRIKKIVHRNRSPEGIDNKLGG